MIYEKYEFVSIIVIIGASCILVLGALLIPDADAATYNKFISIIRSNTCEMTNCIKVTDLIKYDNSTQKISGKLILSPSGDYIRQKGMPNHLNWYNANKPGKTIIFVEPDQQTIVRSKQIIIKSSLVEYAPPTNLTKSYVAWDKTKYITYKGAYIDPKCDVATVGIKEYPDLNIIIQHLGSDCKTDIKNKIEHITPKTKLNYCGKECQWQKYKVFALSKSKQLLINKNLNSTISFTK